jgi:hypothetical protein
MKIKLPIQTKEIIDGKLVIKSSKIELKIDTSLLAQQRFESKFPKLAEKEDLEGYSKRICAVETLSIAVIISKMKMLYCWFDTDMSFEDFLRLFDLTDIEYIKKMTNAIKEAFEIIFNASAEKNS